MDRRNVTFCLETCASLLEIPLAIWISTVCRRRILLRFSLIYFGAIQADEEVTSRYIVRQRAMSSTCRPFYMKRFLGFLSIQREIRKRR
ncbi:hypothetical protein E4T56_gene13532 [Termitomyces sp. T112]|nr:hypothetical protein E4T56_gene13532 [Termitomyces sp. T112]